jgi:UDP-3-O-[3-hydroxymyristoyl] glucosamine N-acyltransferase
MNARLQEAIERRGIRVARRGERAVATLGKLDMAHLPDRLAFSLRENFVDQASREAGIAALVVPPALVGRAAEARPDWWVLAHPEPLRAFWELHLDLLRNTDFYGVAGGPAQVDSTARVSSAAIVEDGVIVGPGCVVEPFAVLHRGVVLGARVRIGSHCVIGRDGFESTKQDGLVRHIDHAGGVEIADDVDLHAAVHVDRAIWGKTTIGRGTQIDNMSHVAHACRLGENNVLAAAVIVGGVVRVGNDNFFGMNCTIKQNISIGSRCRIAMGSAILTSLGDDVKIVMEPALTDRDLLAKMRAEARRR